MNEAGGVWEAGVWEAGRGFVPWSRHGTQALAERAARRYSRRLERSGREARACARAAPAPRAAPDAAWALQDATPPPGGPGGGAGGGLPAGLGEVGGQRRLPGASAPGPAGVSAVGHAVPSSAASEPPDPARWLEDVDEAILAAARDLVAARTCALQPTVPATPAPRACPVRISRTPEMSVYMDGGYYAFRGPRPVGDLPAIGNVIRGAIGAEPRVVLEVIRQIEAATRWCRRVAAARARQAQQILRDQAAAVAAVEARATAARMGGAP